MIERHLRVKDLGGASGFLPNTPFVLLILRLRGDEVGESRHCTITTKTKRLPTVDKGIQAPQEAVVLKRLCRELRC